jgi:protein SCO1
MNEKKSLQPILVIVAGIALIGGLFTGFFTENKQAQNPPEIHGTLLPSGKPVTAFQLVNQNNLPFSEQNLRDNWSLIFIGYTHCPDVCPTTLTTLQQSTELMQAVAMSVPKVIFISIDPARDTPDVLAQYVSYFNKDFIGLTGSETELKNVSKQLAAYYNKAAGASGDINNNDYLMDHSTALVLINPKAEIQAFLVAPHIPEQIIESVKRSVQYYNDIQ